MSTVVQPGVYQSRWGFHPCDRDTFLKLKEYHRAMLRAFRQYRRWGRWDRKTVYRHGPEPVYFADLTYVSRWTGFREFARHGTGGPNLYHHVLAQYRAARMPRPDPESVAPLDLPQGWETSLAALREWFSPQPSTE